MVKFAKIIRENKEIFLIKNFINLFKSLIENNKKERFSFVLTGGNSPINLYKQLSITKNIPWGKVDFFMGDERYVGENSKYSNIKMCKKFLLKKLKISKKQIYQISTKNKLIANDVKNYENKLKKYFKNKKKSFDLILLGVGNDGHIASLFKENISKKNNKNVYSVVRNDFLRITLSINCINRGKSIFLWAPGNHKRKIIYKLMKDKKLKYPASFLNKKNTFLFYSY